jgi:hypothetical protein
MLNSRSGKAALRFDARSLLSEEGLPVRRYELVRPTRREHLPCARLDETSWAETSEAEFVAAWENEVREAQASMRTERLQLATGLLLPVWDKLPEDAVQVIRIAALDGRSLLGRQVPATCLGELGAKLGIDIAVQVPPDELGAMVLSTGKAVPFQTAEQVSLKRALVNGSQRSSWSAIRRRASDGTRRKAASPRSFAIKRACSCPSTAPARYSNGWRALPTIGLATSRASKGEGAGPV